MEEMEEEVGDELKWRARVGFYSPRESWRPRRGAEVAWSGPSYVGGSRKHKRAASSSRVAVSQDQGVSTSHAAIVMPLNSIAIKDYVISDVSMLRTVIEFGPQNLSFVDNQQEPVHDDIFDTTLLDKPANP
ncbi:hypothetical protein Tco_0227455 [Tanacetum coccineum]